MTFQTSKRRTRLRKKRDSLKFSVMAPFPVGAMMSKKKRIKTTNRYTRVSHANWSAVYCWSYGQMQERQTQARMIHSTNSKNRAKFREKRISLNFSIVAPISLSDMMPKRKKIKTTNSGLRACYEIWREKNHLQFHTPQPRQTVLDSRY